MITEYCMSLLWPLTQGGWAKIKDFKAKNLILLRRQLKEMKENSITVSIKVSTDMRNYLMTMISIGNTTRCSNLMNMTIEHLEDATDDIEYKNMKCVASRLYKTSLIYGKKVLMVPI